MRMLRRIADALVYAGAIGGGLAMFLMMAQVGADVVLKYLFNRPVQYTLEMVSSYYMVAVVFLPLGLVTRAKAHVIVELFTQGLSKRALALVDALAYLLAFVYAALITRQAVRVALEKTHVRESWEAATLDIQVWPARWFLPIGTGLMALYLIVLIIENLGTFFGGPSGEDVTEDTTEPSDPPAPVTKRLEKRLRMRSRADLQQSMKDPAAWSH